MTGTGGDNWHTVGVLGSENGGEGVFLCSRWFSALIGMLCLSDSWMLLEMEWGHSEQQNL